MISLTAGPILFFFTVKLLMGLVNGLLGAYPLVYGYCVLFANIKTIPNVMIYGSGWMLIFYYVFMNFVSSIALFNLYRCFRDPKG